MKRLLASFGGLAAAIAIAALPAPQMSTQSPSGSQGGGVAAATATPTLIPAVGAPRATMIPTPLPVFPPAPVIQPGSVTPAFTREQALAYARDPGSGAKSISQIDAKLTTIGQFFRAQGQPETVSGLDPSTLIWIVSISGDFQMPIGHGLREPWGALVVDATTGKALGSLGDSKAPAWVTALPDLGR